MPAAVGRRQALTHTSLGWQVPGPARASPEPHLTVAMRKTLGARTRDASLGRKQQWPNCPSSPQNLTKTRLLKRQSSTCCAGRNRSRLSSPDLFPASSYQPFFLLKPAFTPVSHPACAVLPSPPPASPAGLCWTRAAVLTIGSVTASWAPGFGT